MLHVTASQTTMMNIEIIIIKKPENLCMPGRI
jgi:hypothetical protein